MKYLNERQRQSYKKRVVKDSKKYGATKASRMYGVHRTTIYEWRKSVVNGVRPGDVIRYELILTGGDGPGTYSPRVDVSDILNKADMVNLGGGTLEGTDLVFPQKLCAGCDEQRFSFFVRAKDVCANATSMMASINNIKVVVPFDCNLTQSGPNLLLFLSIGLILTIMGYFIFSLRREKLIK